LLVQVSKDLVEFNDVDDDLLVASLFESLAKPHHLAPYRDEDEDDEDMEDAGNDDDNGQQMQIDEEEGRQGTNETEPSARTTPRLTVLTHALLEHNILALSTLYANISRRDLAQLLQTTESRAQRAVARMLDEGRLRISHTDTLSSGPASVSRQGAPWIDQIKGLIVFQDAIRIESAPRRTAKSRGSKTHTNATTSAGSDSSCDPVFVMDPAIKDELMRNVFLGVERSIQASGIKIE